MTETPAEKIWRWLHTSGPGQTAFGWIALVPFAMLIFLFVQLFIAMALSWIGAGNDVDAVRFIANTLNAALGPFLIIKYGSLVAPSFRHQAGIALAVVAVIIVGLFRLAAEMSQPQHSDARTVWLLVGAVLCGVSIWGGLRSVFRAAHNVA